MIYLTYVSVYQVLCVIIPAGQELTYDDQMSVYIGSMFYKLGVLEENFGPDRTHMCVPKYFYHVMEVHVFVMSTPKGSIIPKILALVL